MSLFPPFSFHEHVIAPWQLPWADGPFWTVVLGILVSIACGWVGSFLLLQRQALLGDAISHSVLPGIVLAYLLTGQTVGVATFVGAVIAGGLTAGAIQILQHSASGIREDSATGIVFTSAFAVGVVLLSTFARNAHLDVQHSLFGDLSLALLEETRIAGVTVPTQVLQMAALLITIMLTTAIFYKECLVTTFDPGFAQSVGFRPGLFRFGLLMLLSLVIVAAFSAVGAILSVAMLVAPAACGLLWSRRLPAMLLVASVTGVIASLGGYHLAYWLDASVSAAMVCVAMGVFAFAVLFANRDGIIPTAVRRLERLDLVTQENLLRDVLAVETNSNDLSTSSKTLLARRETPGLLARFGLWRLQRSGAIARVHSETGKGWLLTEQGRQRAEQLDRAHRLWESFLVSEVGLPPDHVHASAELLEHTLSPQLVEVVDDSLGHPDLDPHGSPIPRSGFIDHPSGYVALAKLRVGDRGRVVGIAPTAAASDVSKLGIALASEIELFSRDLTADTWTVRIAGDQQIVLSHELADSLLVDRRTTPRESTGLTEN